MFSLFMHCILPNYFFHVNYFAYMLRLDEIIIVNRDKFFLNSPCQIFFVYISAVPLKLEEKRDVTDHDQKVDDFLNGPDLRRLFKRKLAKIQPFIFITKQFVSVKRVKVIHWFCSAHLLLHITIWPLLKRANL